MTPSSKAHASSSMSMPARQRQGNLEEEGGLVDIRMPLLVCLIYMPCVFLLLLLILIAALQFQPTVGLKDEDEITTKVDEDSLDFRQSLRQVQPPKNTQHGPYLTDERRFEDTEDTCPSNSTYAIHEVELGSIQPLTQQHASHDAHHSSPVTDERTSDVTGHLSPSDNIVTIHGDELDAIQPLTQRQTSPDAYQRTPDVTDHASLSDHIVMINGIELGATQPQTQLQTSPDVHWSTLDERMSTNGTDQMVPSILTNINNRQQQNPLHGFLSRVAPSTDDRFIVALPFLLGLLHLILPIG